MKKLLCSCFALLMIFVLVGCGANDVKKTRAEDLDEGQYLLYYTDSKAVSVSTYVYESKSADAVVLAKEFIDSMKNVSEETSVSVLPEKMNFSHAELNEGILYIHFVGGSNSFTNASKLIFISSLTKAICQIDKVSGIQLYDDEGFMKDSNGNAYEVLKPDQFTEIN